MVRNGSQCEHKRTRPGYLLVFHHIHQHLTSSDVISYVPDIVYDRALEFTAVNETDVVSALLKQ